jgi:hypothetical protein
MQWWINVNCGFPSCTIAEVMKQAVQSVATQCMQTATGKSILCGENTLRGNPQGTVQLSIVKSCMGFDSLAPADWSHAVFMHDKDTHQLYL